MRALVLVLLVGCGGGLSSQDKATLTDAARLNLMADQMLDGGPARALERGALCATASVLAHNGASVPDSGIQCQPQ